MRELFIISICSEFCEPWHKDMFEAVYMLAIPELAMPRTNKVTTVCNGKREVWTDYERAVRDDNGEYPSEKK